MNFKSEVASDVANTALYGGGGVSLIGFILQINWVSVAGSLTAIMGLIFTIIMKIHEQKQKDEEARQRLIQMQKEEERRQHEHELLLEIMRENAKEVINQHFKNIDNQDD